MEEVKNINKDIEKKFEELENNLIILSEKLNEVISCLNDHKIYRKIPIYTIDYDSEEDLDKKLKEEDKE